MSTYDEQERRAARAERERAIRDELLLRRRERAHGPVLLYEVFDAEHPPMQPVPDVFRGRSITRICTPVSPFGPKDSAATRPGLYRVMPRGLVRLPTPQREEPTR